MGSRSPLSARGSRLSWRSFSGPACFCVCVCSGRPLLLMDLSSRWADVHANTESLKCMCVCVLMEGCARAFADRAWSEAASDCAMNENKERGGGCWVVVVVVVGVGGYSPPIQPSPPLHRCKKHLAPKCNNISCLLLPVPPHCSPLFSSALLLSSPIPLLYSLLLSPLLFSPLS